MISKPYWSCRCSVYLCVGLIVASVALAAKQNCAADESQATRELAIRRAFRSGENAAKNFQDPDRFFTHRTVHASSQVWQLEPSRLARSFSPTYVWEGRTYDLADFLQRSDASALLIIKDDQIVLERYLAGSTPSTRFLSFSVSKSFVSTLLGIALEEGHIGSLDDPLTRYVPSLSGTAYDGVSIENALLMLSGVEFAMGESAESWQDTSKSGPRIYQGSFVEQKFRFVDGAKSLERAAAVGERFHYSDMDAAIIGAVIRKATGQTLAAYMQQKLWEPVGMEFDATWLLDGPVDVGDEVGAFSFAATLRDYGRMGLVALHHGEGNGRRIVSPKWFRMALSPQQQEVEYGRLGYGDWGYGYYWWLWPTRDGCFEAEGAFGQFITVAPHENLVMVKLSHWPTEWIESKAEENMTFFQAVRAALK
jgi:CubicO group peptidase (beta-lactamase class C family)